MITTIRSFKHKPLNFFWWGLVQVLQRVSVTCLCAHTASTCMHLLIRSFADQLTCIRFKNKNSTLILIQYLIGPALIQIHNYLDSIILDPNRDPRSTENNVGYKDTLPWQQTHVWLTDERCVTREGDGSNIFHLSTHLLSLLPIPHHQIHPFPTKLCSELDEGAPLYERWLNETTERGVLDYVVLGVGGDGHVAYLFPGAGQTWSKLVELVKVPGATNLTQRMMLTHKALQLARHVGLLLSGSSQEKHGVLTALKACFGSPSSGCELPAYGVVLSRYGYPTSVYVDARLLQ